LFTRRTAVVSVINDLVTDNRVRRTAEVLTGCGYEVMLIGRQLPGSMPLPHWDFRSVRMRMLFRKGPLFYFFFNLRLLFKLVFSKAELLVSNDLDTLLPNYLVSRLKRIPLIYDSHELFCEVPELRNAPLKRRIWQSLEKMIVPRLKTAITVNESIAGIFEKEYSVKFHVIRNIATRTNILKYKTRQELGLPAHKTIVLMQGAGINMERGAEELIQAMTFVEDCLLLVIGSGDIWHLLERMVETNSLKNKVRMIKRIPAGELAHYTHNADLGVSLDKNTNLNYFYSLPNKIFDYIHAGVPILASRMPEIEKIITRFQIGEFIENHEPAHIAQRINDLRSSGRLATYRQNCNLAAAELDPEKERQKLKDLVLSIDGKMYF
jgi:glycosyltransferase involved in cell wall biosynthesis